MVRPSGEQRKEKGMRKRRKERKVPNFLQRSAKHGQDPN